MRYQPRVYITNVFEYPNLNFSPGRDLSNCSNLIQSIW